MKNLLLITAILSFSIQILSAQPHQRRAQIKKMKLEYIKEKLQLTDEEEQKFISVYTEFENKQEAIHDKKREIMWNFKRNNLNLSEDELIKLSDDFVAQDVALAKLREEYHKKFKAVLPPVKVILLYRSEHEFKRDLIHKMRGNGNGMPFGTE